MVGTCSQSPALNQHVDLHCNAPPDRDVLHKGPASQGAASPGRPAGNSNTGNTGISDDSTPPTPPSMDVDPPAPVPGPGPSHSAGPPDHAVAQASATPTSPLGQHSDGPGTPPPGTMQLHSPAAGLIQPLVGLHVDEQYVQLGIPDLYHSAFNLLNGHTISMKKSNKPTPVTLTATQAYEVVSMFFSEMFCTTHERIQDIVRNVEGYNAACRANVAGADESAPAAIQQVFKSLSAIARRDTPTTLKYLAYNIHNVQLRDSWEKVRESLAAGDGSSRQYIEYLGLRPKVGTTYISLAKKALCTKAGISTEKFADYLRNAQVPAALVQHFGPGGLLFCPNNMSG